MVQVLKTIPATIVNTLPVYNVQASYINTNALAPAPAVTQTIDLSLSNRHTVTFSNGNLTLAISNATVGQIFLIELIQDATGSRTVTWFTTIKWSGGSAPTLTTTASKKDTFGFIVTGSGTYDAYVVGQNI